MNWNLPVAWKQTAKLYRDFYNITYSRAREWQGKCFKAEEYAEKRNKDAIFWERKFAIAERRVAELEAEMENWLEQEGKAVIDDSVLRSK